MKKLITITFISICMIALSSCDGKTYKYVDLYDWVENVNNETLKEIKIVKGYIGVAPEYQISESYIVNNQEEFLSYINTLNEDKLELTTYDICGGSYIEVTYCLYDGEEYTIKYNNGVIFVGDKCYKKIQK